MAEAKEDSETWDAGEGGTAVQHENEDFCDVCGLEGDLVCCDYCPKSYHKQCHDPPMRNVPRGVWKCCTCQGRRPRARTKRVYREGELDDPSYFPEGVASKRSKLDENFDSCSSSNETVDSASSDDDDDDDALPARRTRNIVSKPTRASAVESAPPRQTKYANKERNADSRTRRDNKAVCLSKNEIPEARSRRNTSVVDKSRTGSPDEKENALDVRPARNPRQSDKKGTRKRRHSPEKENGGVNEGRRKSRQDSELKNCELLLKDLIKHEDSWPFLKPVDLSEVPDYLEVVSSPMDFETIRGRLDGLEYGCYQDFINDVRLVFSDSDKYNLETSEHGLAGISLEAYFKEILPSYFPKYENKILRSRNCSKRNTKRRL